MSTITIHAEDYLAVAVRDYAAKMGKSVNLAVKDLLSSALDLVRPAKRREPSFMKCCGTLDAKSAAEIRAVQADFSKIASPHGQRRTGAIAEGSDSTMLPRRTGHCTARALTGSVVRSGDFARRSPTSIRTDRP